ncbi:HupE/UreJ family protein [Rhizobiaceae bacterium n13]|uniref:HupE/UreJ family protein n=1 Tax=Ferirhizobium litorale TaxID=2927786 RepID=A0AAE3QLF0_9HYPH|nr:HupE/UreJ family protein [Fererhizobium litorale]MDI7865031.1 HupE/UreJ family protein [Fererhizobium litorale]MDI7925203.1 HupE/UreJ family protein [Fererhizobium litorale]
MSSDDRGTKSVHGEMRPTKPTKIGPLAWDALTFRYASFLGTCSVVAGIPSLALAHTGSTDTSGFVHGFSHPISVLDHVVAMIMVGVLAWQLGGRALWLLPATFLMVMAIGGTLGVLGIGVPFVEVGIALSVLVLGVIVALEVRAPAAVAMGIVGLFAVFHGHAHGAEMPETVEGVAYALGFVAATTVLHVAGLSIGLLLGKVFEKKGALAVKSTGAVAALAGAGLLIGLI